MRIAELVKDNLGKIFRHCEADAVELTRLMSAEYSRRTFGLAWSFCADASQISAKDHPRYWAEIYIVGNRRVRVCSQWYDRQWDTFWNYLAAKRIALPSPQPATRPPRPRPVSGSRKGRYGSIQIGDAQNTLIRFVLSRLGEESFDERSWQETKAHFGNGCAYCEDGLAEQMDHGVPINRAKLGEHRLGNVIPACRVCNTRKHHRDFREHLRDDLARIERIESFMAGKGYIPLGDNKQVKDILEQAHGEVAALAQRYIDMLDDVLSGII